MVVEDCFGMAIVLIDCTHIQVCHLAINGQEILVDGHLLMLVTPSCTRPPILL